MFNKLKKFLKNFFEIVEFFKEVRSIARRMFITNSFDSIFASLGVMIGAYEPYLNSLILGMSILGSSLTMGIFSSVISVYFSERNERLKELKDLEKTLMVSLKDSIYGKSINFLSLYVSLWSGFGAFVFTSLISLPFFISYFLNFNITHALIISLFISFVELGYLGYYMGKISNENVLINIIKNIVLGLLAIAFVSLVKYALRIYI
ncbi:hypothetical protein [Caldisphaera sp.]|jgi:predicted membrane protein (TIGR00267 family)|uniref:hypothetical protein n=1 Tax=Caldisphaera sp. TaxID=2060322 RepID=UPI003D0FFD12